MAFEIKLSIFSSTFCLTKHVLIIDSWFFNLGHYTFNRTNQRELQKQQIEAKFFTSTWGAALPHSQQVVPLASFQEEKGEHPRECWAVPSAAYTVLMRCLREGEERVVNHLAVKIIENVCTTRSCYAQGFITGEIGPVLWYLFTHSTGDSLKITPISALCRITRSSPNAFQSVIEKVGLTAVLNSLANGICKIQQYMLTMFSAMLSCGIHLQRLIQEKDFVTTITRLLESPSTFIRAKAFLVLLQILINNREMLLLSCQTR
ncbi:hypothetical protein Nmel_000646 [Mimus melanotis]